MAVLRKQGGHFCFRRAPEASATPGARPGAPSAFSPRRRACTPP